MTGAGVEEEAVAFVTDHEIGDVVAIDVGRNGGATLRSDWPGWGADSGEPAGSVVREDQTLPAIAVRHEEVRATGVAVQVSDGDVARGPVGLAEGPGDAE